MQLCYQLRVKMGVIKKLNVRGLWVYLSVTLFQYTTPEWHPWAKPWYKHLEHDNLKERPIKPEGIKGFMSDDNKFEKILRKGRSLL